MVRNTLSLAISTVLAIGYFAYSANSEEISRQQSNIKDTDTTQDAHTTGTGINTGTPPAPITAITLTADKIGTETPAQPTNTQLASRFDADQAKAFFKHKQLKPLTRGDSIFLTSSSQTPLYAVTPDDAKNILLQGGNIYLGLTDNDNLNLESAKRDPLGNVIYKYKQTYNDVPVFGREVVIQISPKDEVNVIAGQLEPQIDLATTPQMSADDALNQALVTLPELPQGNVEILEQPQLMVYTDENTQPTLAYRTSVEYTTAESGYRKEQLFINANTGEPINQITLMHSALSYGIYTLSNQCLQSDSQLPGTQIQDPDSDGDHAAGVKVNGEKTYAFYQSMFGRDSWDDNGRKIVSTVHARFQTQSGCGSDNAFFTGSQLVFGDGSNALINPGAAYDIFAHEFTHGFTSAESNLTYQNESGAINEAMSDIMGASATAWTLSGGTSGDNPNSWTTDSTVWTMGEDSAQIDQYKRRFDDPAANGDSKDNYPDRYTGSDDNGGVHSNSGIMNLAFYLLSQGGTHPRDKSNINVTGVGIEKAMHIYYYANDNLFTSSTSFQSARQALATAAKTLYGCDEWESVHESYDAVNVPGTRGDECATDTGGDTGGTGGDTGGSTGGDTGGDTTPPTADENIAIGSAYKASSTYSSNYPVQNSTDDNTSSLWVSRNIIYPSAEEYVMLNLGSAKTISSVNIKWNGSDAAGVVGVHIWQNGQWVNVANQSGSPATSVSFNQQQAQYLVVTMKNGYYRRWYAISEIEVK